MSAARPPGRFGTPSGIWPTPGRTFFRPLREAMPCYVAPPAGDAGVMYCKPGCAHPFAPSKDLADCWLALGALRKKGWDVSLTWGRDGRGSCAMLEAGRPILLVTDASPHMASVKACLLAALGLSREG